MIVGVSVAVGVTVKVPVVAVAFAESVKRLLAVAGSVPKVALTPLGTPEAAKVTGPLNPLSALMVMVAEAAAP